MKKDDSLWKGILEDIFDDFLRFFYPDADDMFDIERGFDFLDKELAQLFPEIEQENIRYVDKLIKVWLKNGHEEWILIHIEVQGTAENIFSERMFTYFYRIRDKYKRKITAWAILTDKNKRFLPTQYQESYLGTSLTYSYNTYKVINQDESELRKMENPFAVVILTVLLALKKDKTNQLQLIDLKMDLVKDLIKSQIPTQKIRALMNFLRHYVRFNKENTLIFEKKLEQFTGKTYPMGIEQLLLHKAEKKGELKGEKKGKLEGEKKGKLEASRIATINLLREKLLSVDVIARVLDVPIAFVKQIQTELDKNPDL